MSVVVNTPVTNAIISWNLSATQGGAIRHQDGLHSFHTLSINDGFLIFEGLAFGAKPLDESVISIYPAHAIEYINAHRDPSATGWSV